MRNLTLFLQYVGLIISGFDVYWRTPCIYRVQRISKSRNPGNASRVHNIHMYKYIYRPCVWICECVDDVTHIFAGNVVHMYVIHTGIELETRCSGESWRALLFSSYYLTSWDRSQYLSNFSPPSPLPLSFLCFILFSRFFLPFLFRER